jgi:hypothetical protein
LPKHLAEQVLTEAHIDPDKVSEILASQRWEAVRDIAVRLAVQPAVYALAWSVGVICLYFLAGWVQRGFESDARFKRS